MPSTQRYVYFAYLVLGVVLWISMAKLFGTLAYAADVVDPQLLGSNFSLSTLMGLLVALGAGIFAVRSPLVSDYSNDVALELHKVTWPAKKETKAATVVVIVTTIVVSVLLGVFDQLWANFTGFILRSR